MKQLAIVAHRGASALAPENTLAAFQAALDLGVTTIETDLRVTADGQPVLLHDATLERLTGQPDAIADCQYADLRQVVLSHDASGQPQTICTPAELLALVGDRASVLFDLKVSPYQIVDLLATLSNPATKTSAILGVRSLDVLHLVQSAAPALPTLAFGTTLADVVALLAAGATIARLWAPWVTEPTLAQIRQYRCPIWVMCGNAGDGSVGTTTVTELRYYRQLGIDAVLLNDPRLALAANAEP